eukprot:FR744373.1.p1 GENE.FR744373.1~~FR744373.1.p1  ORF type:complete len:192 (+),score=24.48 FR744373.1:3-578(+)
MLRLLEKRERALASDATTPDRLTDLHRRITKRARIQSRHDSRDYSVASQRFEDTTVDRISSRFVGVSWKKANKKWTVRINLDRSKVEHIGYYEAEEDAATAYDKRARVLGKETNFDDDGNERVRGKAKVTSRHWGVGFNQEVGKYQAQLRIGKQVLNLGYFVDETRAARAFDAAARALPEHTRFNFILKEG